MRDGVALAKKLCARRDGVTAFYDIDTPVTMAKLTRGECDYISADVIPQFDLYLSFTGGPSLKWIENRYRVKRAVPLYCSVDEMLYRPISAKPKWDLSYLGTYSPDRQPTLDRLLIDTARKRPGMKFAVAGPQYPDGIAWPDNVERIEHVAPDDHPAFYAASRFTLNVTRGDMIEAGYSPSVRLFEAGACGCPVLSDAWNGLETLFELGREIVICADTADALAALDMPEATRRGIAKAARARILAEHTGEHRARELETYLISAGTRSSEQTDGSGTQGERGVSKRKLRVGIVGVGNCASSFVQGLSHYAEARSNVPVPGPHECGARRLSHRRHRAEFRFRHQQDKSRQRRCRSNFRSAEQYASFRRRRNRPE